MKRILSFISAATLASTFAFGGGCSSSDDNSAQDSGGGADGPTDAKADKKPAPEASDDTGGDDTGSSTCPTPADVSKWTPPAYKHAKSGPNCTTQQISDYVANCPNAGYASAGCTSWRKDPANTGCLGCLESNESDAKWGALVNFKVGVINGNIGGCIELTDPSNTTCPAAVQASVLCEHQACDAVCPVKDQNSFTQWQQCVTNADGGGCSQYVTATQCVGQSDGGSVKCNDPTWKTFGDVVQGIAPIFCGGAGSDAGPSDGGGG